MVGILAQKKSENTSNQGAPCLRAPVAKYLPQCTTGLRGQGWQGEERLGTGTRQERGFQGGGSGDEGKEVSVCLSTSCVG